MSLKKKLINGALWNSVSQILSQAINFVTTIFLARLLTPQDFGLLGQVAVITGLVSFLSEFGFMPSLIQKKDIDDIDLNTAYYGTIALSIIVYALVFFSAPLVGSFYNDDKLVLITRVLFIQFIIASFGFVNDLLEFKNLSFNKITISEILSIFISGIIGIIMAYKGFGVWSLVWQSIIRAVFKSIIIISITKWRPKFIFSFSIFIELIKSGAHFTYRNLTLYISENIDFLLIGKIAGAQMLGVYNIAFRMSNYPFTKIQKIFGKMLFPTFSMFIEDTEKVRKNYLKITLLGGLILIPALVFIFFGIDLIVTVLLGAKWNQSIDIVRILVFYLIFSSISFADDSIMLAMNEIKKLNIVKSIVFSLLLISGIIFTNLYGAKGMAFVFSFFSILYIIAIKIILLKLLNIKSSEFILKLKDIILLGIVLIAVYSCIILFTFPFMTNPIVKLTILVMIYFLLMLFYFIKKNIINIKTKSINLEVL